MKCVTCHGKKVEKAALRQTYDFKGLKVCVLVPAARCTTCGAEIVEGLDLQRAELTVAASLVSSGRIGGEAFRFARKALGLTAEMLATLLGVSKFTLSRWETEERNVDRAAWALLGAMVRERLEGGPEATKDSLAAVDKPRAIPRTLRAVRGARVAAR